MSEELTALAHWSEMLTLSQPLTGSGGVDGNAGRERSNDAIVTFRAGGNLPVIIWNPEVEARRVQNMRWGSPDSHDWRRPRLIHGHAETIASKQPFRAPFHAGQRGIVMVRTFNEGEEDGQPRGFAFVWQQFDVPAQPIPLLACVMVTVPANELIRRTVNARKRTRACPRSSKTMLGRSG